MAKAVVKLFRDPEEAVKVVKELLIRGFDAKDIGMLMRQRDNVQLLQSLLNGITVEHTTLPDIGTVIGSGPLAFAMKQPDLGQALINALNITTEALEYYRFGILVGGILISVHDSSEERLKKAQAVLRAATPKPQRVDTGARCPAFTEADRMNATNQVDASLSGDFRKY